MLRERLSVHLRQLESKVRKNAVHTVNMQLSKASALCMASDVLLVADDGLRVKHQVSLERDGVTIRGKSMRTLSNYPTHIESVESMTILESNVYFAGSKNDKSQGGLYSVSIETTLMECAIQNGDQSCKETKRVSKFNELLVFTDIGAREVKSFITHPPTKLYILLGMDVMHRMMVLDDAVVLYKLMVFPAFQTLYLLQTQQQEK